MTCDIVPRIMDQKMVLDTPHALPHPTRSSITTFRKFLGAGSAPSLGRPATQRRRGRNPTFLQLKEGIQSRLKTLKHDQTPNLVGAAKILRQQVPWTRKSTTTKD